MGDHFLRFEMSLWDTGPWHGSKFIVLSKDPAFKFMYPQKFTHSHPAHHDNTFPSPRPEEAFTKAHKMVFKMLIESGAGEYLERLLKNQDNVWTLV